MLHGKYRIKEMILKKQKKTIANWTNQTINNQPWIISHLLLPFQNYAYGGGGCHFQTNKIGNIHFPESIVMTSWIELFLGELEGLDTTLYLHNNPTAQSWGRPVRPRHVPQRWPHLKQKPWQIDTDGCTCLKHYEHSLAHPPPDLHHVFIC